MRNSGPLDELYPFRVDQDHLAAVVAERETVQNGVDQAIDDYGLTGTSGAGDEQVGLNQGILVETVDRASGRGVGYLHRQNLPFLLFDKLCAHSRPRRKVMGRVNAGRQRPSRKRIPHMMC